jgi:uncharacterized protein
MTSIGVTGVTEARTTECCEDFTFCALGVDCDVLCTLNVDTAAQPLDVYRFFLNQGVRWLQFIPVVKRTPDGNVAERSMTPEAMGSFLCSVFDE